MKQQVMSKIFVLLCVLFGASAAQAAGEAQQIVQTTTAEVMERKVATVALNASSSDLPRIFERGEVAIVVDDAREVIGIVTKLDLIEMIAARKNQMP